MISVHSKIYVLTERKQQQAREAVFGHTGTSSDSFCYSYTKEAINPLLFGFTTIQSFSHLKTFQVQLDITILLYHIN